MPRHDDPFELLRELPEDFKTRRRIAKLIAKETALPLHKRKFFGGLPGDYRINDENGKEMWASEWCHRAYIDTCPRGLHRRSRP